MAWNKLSKYETRWETDGQYGYVRYHSTNIVTWNANVVTLETNGWKGVTTKRKMNQASYQFGLGYSVHQHKHEWFVTTAFGVFPFDDHAFSFDRATGIPVGMDTLPDMALAAAKRERIAA